MCHSPMAVLKMSKAIDQVALSELLPSSISSDSQAQAASDAVQPQLNSIGSSIPLIELYRQIDTLAEPILRMLAWENRVFGAEWALARTIEDKRALVKGSFELNKRRGTLWAVERVFELLRLKADIVEWWEEGGQPATFRIAILDVSGRGILESELSLIDELIYTYKPLTRHNLGINMLTGGHSEVYAHGAISFISELTIQPARIGDIDQTYPVRMKSSASLVACMTLS